MLWGLGKGDYKIESRLLFCDYCLLDSSFGKRSSDTMSPPQIITIAKIIIIIALLLMVFFLKVVASIPVDAR